MLAARLPYCQATDLLRSFVQVPIDHCSLYRLAQRAGAAIVAEEDKLQQSVFTRGEIPDQAAKEREIILAAVDDTLLCAQRDEEP